MYCTGCGQAVSQGARFCSYCGAAVVADTTGSTADTSYPAGQQSMRRVLRRRTGKMIAGVCAGIAQTYGWDISLVRFVFAFSAILLFPVGLIAYAVAWVIFPEEPLSLPGSSVVA